MHIMQWKRCLAAFLCALMLWPSAGLYAAAENGFTPAEPPQGMYPVTQTISDRRQIPYRKDGYRASLGVTYASQTRQTPVEHLALYMNVYIDNPEGEVQDLIDKARYRQIDIQRYIDGEYHEVRWTFDRFTLHKGWNRLLLRFDTAKDVTFKPQDDRMIVANANRQTINWDETANFNFALTMVEDGSCTNYTIILDDVAIVDTSAPLVNEARPSPPNYWLLQDIRGELPDQELTRVGGGLYQASSSPIAVSPAAQEAPRDRTAVYMNLYVEDHNLPYHTGLFRDGVVDRRLTLSDGRGGEVVWNGDSFDRLELKPGWNTVVWRLTTGEDVWDGIPCADTDADSLSLSGTLRLTMTLNGPGGDYDSYRIQIASVALVDVSRRADGETYYDTAYDVLRFSGADGAYTPAPAGGLSTGWILADGTSETSGEDIHRHNRSGLRLMMTLTLETDREDWSADGKIRLRSVDGEAGGQGGYWMVRPLKLKKGDNLLSLKLADLLTETNDAPLDYTAVNRFCVELAGSGLETVRLTLADVKLVDIAGRQPGKAAIAEPSAGMAAADYIVYNLNAAEWGADPTGGEDSTTAIQDCLDTLKTTGGVVFLPAGRYQVRGYLSLPAGVTLRGEWRNPDEGGAGKGTILMAYYGADDEQGTAFIRMRGASCLRDISVWYPEQNPADPIPYSTTIEGQGHTVVSNVTLYNAYTGFYNGSCSSMLIRGFYATALKQGIYGANAYDIPRIEQVKIDTRYWIESGLPGAPSGLAADQLNSFTRQHTVGLTGGRQDWGYWYDLEIRNAKIGIFLFAGNDAVGNLRTEKVQYGIYTTNVNAPGLQITHSDISASVEGVHYEVDSGQTLVASSTIFRDAPTGIHTVSKTAYGVSLNDCTFRNWDEQALWLEGGHLTAANNRFEDQKPAIKLEKGVPQALLTGNAFAAADQAVSCTERTLLRRDDTDTSIPPVPDYAFKEEPYYRPASGRIFLVTDYGAREGGTQDCTAAIQDALDAAEKAGGGTVYIPGGFYRLDGGLTVPSGVELRGSFDGAHYGNSTFNGTQLYVYGGKDDEKAPPLLTMGEGAGAKGFTVYYPEQGLSDKGLTEEERVHAYPAVFQADKGCWIENVAMVNAYDGIDAMTNRCDGLVIRDVTGFAMREALRIGHGIVDGYIHNFHLNPSGWGQQGQYPGGPTGAMSADGETSRSKLFEDYATRNADFMTLGDCRDVQIFSCFDIVIRTQMHLVKDPYTGGSFKGATWGVAFDASHNGIVCEGGVDADLTMIAAMGVFNQQGGGYNVVTKPGFTGKVSIFNADAWGGNSKIALVEGGTVAFSQYFSASAYQGVCRENGTLNFNSSVMISRSGDNSGHTPDLTYEDGSRGRVIGNLDCVEKLNVCIEPGAQVEERLNGARLEPSEEAMSFSGTAGQWNAASGAVDTGWIPWDGKTAAFNLNNRNRNNLRLWITATLPGDSDVPAEIQLGGPDDDEQAAVWAVTLRPGKNRLSLPVNALQPDNPLDFVQASRIRLVADTGQTITLSAARLIDLTSIYQEKQRLRVTLSQSVDTAGCRVSDIAAYEKAFSSAGTVYRDESADIQTIQQALAEYEQAVSRLIPLDKEALRALVETAGGLAEDTYTEPSLETVRVQADLARAVLNDSDALQEEVDEAVQALREALDRLEKKPTRPDGDVNGDGFVTAEDALLALQAATHKVELSMEDLQAADVDGDGFVTAVDSLVILQIATNKITQQ